MAKNAAEGVPLDDHEKWMSGERPRGIRQWVKQRKRENVGEGGGIKRATGWRRKAVTITADCEEERHREVVGWRDREGRRCRMPKMWGGRADTGPHSVPFFLFFLWEG